MIFSTFSTPITNVIILTLITILIFYYKWRFAYWKRRNVPGPKPRIPIGNFSNPFSRKLTLYDRLNGIYREMRFQGHRHCGIYFITKPIYVPIDPDYVKRILTKDFTCFSDRGVYYNEKDDPLSAHMLAIDVERWRYLRTKFTPTFTVGKMKMMLHTLRSCADQMTEAIEKMPGESIDIKEICACFTTDVIGSCALGLNCNSFVESDAEFRKLGRKLFEPSFQKMVRIIIYSSVKNLANTLRLKIVNTEAAAFFMNVIKTTLKYREENQVVRNDFLQLLMELRQKNRQELSVEEVAAQSMLFFAAGFETSSTTMSFCIYELAQHEEIQEKVRAEIEDVAAEKEDKWTYEAIMGIKYLNQVVEETLRKYPVIPLLPRICTEDYKLCEGDGYIERGTQVFIPVYSLHYDTEYYPDPERFDPDRFSEENKKTRHPYVYLPFGEGPRNCLGQRFGLLQIKVGLVALLRNYRFSFNASTRSPVTFERKTFLLMTDHPVWLDAVKIKK